MKNLIWLALLLPTIVLFGCDGFSFGGSGGSDGSGGSGGSGFIEITTVKGNKHTLTGTYETGCFDLDPHSRENIMEVNGTDFKLTTHNYVFVLDCSVAAVTSTMEGTLAVVGDQMIVDWLGGVLPAGRDGLGALAPNETVTVYSVAITATTGTQFDDWAPGDVRERFFVADDGDPAGLETYLYEEDDIDAMLANPYYPLIQ